MDLDHLDDAALLLRMADEPETYGLLYRRYERPILAYFMRRVSDPDAAADLTAETFATALASLGRTSAPGDDFAPWLFGVARNVLVAAWRRGSCDDRARRGLEMESITIGEAAADAISQLADDDAVATLVAALPVEQREAVAARILDDRDYADIAADLETSEAVIRKRVSRGLATLRIRLEGTIR